MCAKSVKHLAEVSLVLVLIVTKHEDVTQIHQNKVINLTMHNRVHEILKGSWCIAQPK